MGRNGVSCVGIILCCTRTKVGVDCVRLMMSCMKYSIPYSYDHVFNYVIKFSILVVAINSTEDESLFFCVALFLKTIGVKHTII